MSIAGTTAITELWAKVKSWASSTFFPKTGGNVTGDITFLYKTRRVVELRDPDDELLETYYLDLVNRKAYGSSWEEIGTCATSTETGIGYSTINLLVTITGGNPSYLVVDNTDANAGFFDLAEGTYELDDSSTYNGFSNPVPSGSYVTVETADGAYQERTEIRADGTAYFPNGLKTGDVDATGKKVKAYETDITGIAYAANANVSGTFYYKGLGTIPVYYWGSSDPTSAEMSGMPTCLIVTSTGHLFVNA